MFRVPLKTFSCNLEKLLITIQSHVRHEWHVEKEQKIINCVHNVNQRHFKPLRLFFSSPKKTVISCRRLNTEQTFLRLRLQHKKAVTKNKLARLVNICVEGAFAVHLSQCTSDRNFVTKSKENSLNIGYTKRPLLKIVF